ncbi:unnamed protein product [Rhizophagus irregularis]|nr:unnamed protein product [Rhizophagus irregularis]CAB4428365.1 unnamed protein product [Rhizophagus irregularis]
MSSKSYKRSTERNPYIRETNLNNDDSKRIKERPKNCVSTIKKKPEIINNFTEYPVPMEVDDPTEYALYRSWDPMDLD